LKSVSGCDVYRPEMSDRVTLAREIAARTKPRFVDEHPKRPQTDEGMRKLARVAARTPPRFIEVPREIRGAKVPYTEEQLAKMRGGLTAEEYRRKLLRAVRKGADR
jgi:hypothetical protein